MARVDFELFNGKTIFIKEKVAAHLENKGRGMRVLPQPEIDTAPGVKEEADAIGIDLLDVEGTGKDGRILKRDLKTYKTRMMKAE